MSVFSAAFYTRLATDATLTALLGRYQGAPCLFLGVPIPGPAPRPYLYGDLPWADVPFDTKTTRGREISRDLTAVTDATASPTVVEAILERVRVLLHRQPITIAGYSLLVSRCLGPVAGPSDDTVRVGVLTTIWLAMQD